MVKTKHEIEKIGKFFKLHTWNVHLSLTSKCSDISTMTAMAPNSEHSHIVLKSSVSFSLKEKEVKSTQYKKLVPNYLRFTY